MVTLFLCQPILGRGIIYKSKRGCFKNLRQPLLVCQAFGNKRLAEIVIEVCSESVYTENIKIALKKTPRKNSGRFYI